MTPATRAIFITLSCLLALLARPPAARPGTLAAQFAVRADRMQYYSDRQSIGADGNVVVTLPDGSTVTGESFFMDLRLNRYVVAGDVRLTYHGTTTGGAGFAAFLDYDRVYFLPVTSEPDRWTFLGDDFDHPLRGRVMPGDVFFLPDFSSEHVFLRATSALIVPKQSVRFTQVGINIANGFVSLPSYFLSISSNPNTSQNSLSGAYADAPYPFLGSSHSLSTVHLRYDNLNKFYASFEQSFFSDRSYIVLSANPLTRPQKLYNLIADDRLSPKVDVHTFDQVFAFQHGINQPLAASAHLGVQTTVGLRGSFVQVTGNEYYQSLLAQPQPIDGSYYYGDPNHEWIPNHTADAELLWTGFDRHLTHNVSSPLYKYLQYHLQSGISVAHDSFDYIGTLGGVTYPTVWSHLVGATLYSSSLPIGKDKLDRALVYFNASASKQRQWSSLPHHVDTTMVTGSLSRTFNRTTSAFLSYTVTNIGDFYGAAQSEIYPPSTPVVGLVDGRIYTDYADFYGFSTAHVLAGSLVYTPNPAFNLSLQGQYNNQFPKAVPLPDALVPPGQFPWTGAPYQVSADVRVRLRPNLLLDVSRAYYFSFGTQRWSPTFGIRIGP